MKKDILICGVGGQGTVLASKIIAASAMFGSSFGRDDRHGTAGWFGDEPCAYRGGICTADPTGGSRYDSRI